MKKGEPPRQVWDLIKQIFKKIFSGILRRKLENKREKDCSNS